MRGSIRVGRRGGRHVSGGRGRAGHGRAQRQSQSRPRRRRRRSSSASTAAATRRSRARSTRRGKGATIQIKPGTYSEGVVVQGHQHDGLTIEGIGKTPSAVYLNGTNARVQGNPAQNAIEGDKVNNLTLENMKEEHYAANGFFIKSCHGYTDEEPDRGVRPRLRDVRVPVRRRPDDPVDRLRQRRLGVLHRRHPVSEEARLELGRPRHGLRERARLLGHELQVREDHELDVLQQRRRRGSEHARVRAVRAGDQRHHRATTRSSGTTSTTTCRARRSRPSREDCADRRHAVNYPIGAGGSCCSGRPAGSPRTTRSSATGCGAARAFSDPTDTTGKAMNNGNRFVNNQMGDERQGPERHRLLQRRLGQGHLLSRQRLASDARRPARPIRRRCCTRPARRRPAPAR